MIEALIKVIKIDGFLIGGSIGVLLSLVSSAFGGYYYELIVNLFGSLIVGIYSAIRSKFPTFFKFFFIPLISLITWAILKSGIRAVFDNWLGVQSPFSYFFLFGVITMIYVSILDPG